MIERLPIILLLGKSGVGKDEAGSAILNAAPSTQDVGCMALADKLKAVCADLFDLPREALYTAEGKAREVRPGWTARAVLQHVGTEGFRAVDSDVWVDYLIRGVRKTLADWPYPRIFVVTDGRFRSECEAVWRVGGEVWRIHRPGCGSPTGGIVGHASEAEQDAIADSECQAVIENDSTLEVFRERVAAEFHRWEERNSWRRR